MERYNVWLMLTDESAPTFIGMIEEIKSAKIAGIWTVWVKSRTGPNGVDYHRFKVPHERYPEWVVEMFKAEANK
jgi:hypothetical protein